MLVAELIRIKRDGGELTDEQIDELVQGITDGTASDTQVGAVAMAIFLRGMSAAERVALTGAMTRSGGVLDWSDAGRPVLDKHSTGGVGDKVSLLLAPIVAACGAAVPMISGRGLGHTGGTLDKLEAIPGYDVRPDEARLREVVEQRRLRDHRPDRRARARRPATVRDPRHHRHGRVDPADRSSILSKKLAAGLDALVMDVKVGSGAQFQDMDSAREMAQVLIDVAGGNGMPTYALLTDMNQVLGRTAGNAVEVRESIDHLTGAASDPRLREVTLALCAELLVLGGLHRDLDGARAAASAALDSGAAAERFQTMVVGLGGPADLLGDPDRHLQAAPHASAAAPAEAGIVTAIDVRAIGIAVIGLGGGRARDTDLVDHRVGLTEVRRDRRGRRAGRATARDRPRTRTPTAQHAPRTRSERPTYRRCLAGHPHPLCGMTPIS